jgi:hypothetical protein
VRISCPACGGTIPADDLDLRTGVAKCRACDEVFSFAGTVAAAAPGFLPTPRPPRVREEEVAGGIRLSWRWYRPSVWFLVFFCLFWDGFLVVWYGMALTVFSTAGPIVWLPILFPVIHVAVGVWLTYLVFATFLNTTEVSAIDGDLVVVHRPLPWRRPRPLRSADIRQCFVRRHVSGGKTRARTYVLYAALDDAVVPLVSGLDEVDHALWLEERLERHLGLRHRPVPDEVRGAG